MRILLALSSRTAWLTLNCGAGQKGRVGLMAGRDGEEAGRVVQGPALHVWSDPVGVALVSGLPSQLPRHRFHVVRPRRQSGSHIPLCARSYSHPGAPDQAALAAVQRNMASGHTCIVRSTAWVRQLTFSCWRTAARPRSGCVLNRQAVPATPNPIELCNRTICVMSPNFMTALLSSS